MSESITIADIYKLFEQTNAALNKSREEYDRRLAESDLRLVEYERLEAIRTATNDRNMAELEKTIARTSKSVDALTTRWGRFVEELVRPAVVRMFRERGIFLKRTMERVQSPEDDFPMEIDILGVDGTVLVAVECKSRLSNDDVDEMCDRLRRFKSAFPEYAQYDVYGAVAGIEIDRNASMYAYRKGLFVIRSSGDTVEIANDEKFKPISWG